MAIGVLATTGTAVAGAPTATTGAATAVTGTTATISGTVFANKESTTYYFEWGTTTAYGTKTPTGTAGGNAGKTAADDLPLPARRDQRIGDVDGRRRHVHDDGRRAGAAVRGHDRRHAAGGALRQAGHDQRPGHRQPRGERGAPAESVPVHGSVHDDRGGHDGRLRELLVLRPPDGEHQVPRSREGVAAGPERRNHRARAAEGRPAPRRHDARDRPARALPRLGAAGARRQPGADPAQDERGLEDDPHAHAEDRDAPQRRRAVEVPRAHPHPQQRRVPHRAAGARRPRSRQEPAARGHRALTTRSGPRRRPPGR